MIFIYNLLIIVILGVILRHNPKHKKLYLTICFLQMILIQGLRDISVGTDTKFYVDIYNNYLNSQFYSWQFTHFEYGFQMLYNIFHKLNLTSQQMLMIISFVTMFGFAHFIYKNSANVYISTFIFACMLYPNSFNIMRQFLAMSIAINSYQFIMDKKYIKGLLIILIASLFHVTAYLMLIPLLFNCFKNWKLMRKLIIISSAVCFIYGNKIVNVVLPLVGKSFYLTEYNVNRLFRMTTMLTIVIAILVWYFSRRVEEKEEKQELSLLANIALVNMNFGVLYLKYEFFSRIIESLNLFLLISIPLGITKMKSYYRPLIKIGVYCVPILLMLNAVYNSGSGIEVYKTYFMM